MPQNESLSRGELLEKLNTISNLYAKTKQIQEEMDAFVPEDNYVREVVLPAFPGDDNSLKNAIDHTRDDAEPLMEAVYSARKSPKAPQQPHIRDFKAPGGSTSNFATENKGCLPIICIFAAIFVLINLAAAGGKSVFCWIVIALCGGLIALFVAKIKSAKDQDAEKRRNAEREYKQYVAALMQKYQQDCAVYEDELAAFKLERQTFLEDYAAWRQIYLEHVKEETEISKKLEADRIAAVNKIYEEQYIPHEEKLRSYNDLVPDKYLPVLRTIIDLIKAGRADDLKEAINLYEELLYRERQLQLQREQEAQRRHEEEQCRQAEERRYQEEQRFRENQERQRQREEERRQQEAERRHREEMAQRDRMERDRQNEERRRAEEARRRADRAELDRKQREDRDTRNQCNRCAQVDHCSMAFRRPNCASFRPR